VFDIETIALLGKERETMGKESENMERLFNRTRLPSALSAQRDIPNVCN